MEVGLLGDGGLVGGTQTAWDVEVAFIVSARNWVATIYGTLVAMEAENARS